jgi:5-formyltetrahydrofolate cyclo-ligase
MIIVSCGTDFRDDNLDVVFEWNRARRKDLCCVGDVGFDRSDGERLSRGNLEYNRVILRFEWSAVAREDRGNFLMDTVTERPEVSL